MIDLHSHTTASDGTSTPEQLVAEAAAAGIRTLGVTDHDTTAGLGPARAAAANAGITVVPGIEITAVHDGRDVHMLGYWLDDSDPSLVAFLASQRADRRRRVMDIVARLEAIDAPVDSAPILARANRDDGRAVGRPVVAAALVAAGHARDISDAFDRFLSPGRPAFIERRGASPAAVVALIQTANGLASLAHPGKTVVDEIIPDLAAAGMVGLEVFHPDHDAAAVTRYLELALKLGLLPTGGSDYHGTASGRISSLGTATLPPEHYARLAARVRSAGRS